MSDQNTTPTCAQRIAAHAASRAETFAALTTLASVYDESSLLEALESEEARGILREFAPSDISEELLELLCSDPETISDDVDLENMLIDESVRVDDIAESAQERIHEMPLAVERQTIYRIDLSTGGPADWLEVRCSGDDDRLEIDGVTYVFQDWFDGARQELLGSELEAAQDFARALLPDLS